MIGTNMYKILTKRKCFWQLLSKFYFSCLLSLCSMAALLFKAWIVMPLAPNSLDHSGRALYKASLAISRAHRNAHKFHKPTPL